MDINNLGLGVMIKMLGGNAESVAAFQKGVGKVIRKVHLKDDALHFAFADGYKMAIADGGQSCCEHRYMTTDDDLNTFEGATLLGVEIKSAPDMPDDEYGEQHEVEFLEIQTNRGVFTMTNHNEHNGYYGGFCVEVQEEKA